MTGNLNVNPDARVRNIISKGPKYRFPSKIVSEYDQELPQSQTADNPVPPRGRAVQPSRDISIKKWEIYYFNIKIISAQFIINFRRNYAICY